MRLLMALLIKFSMIAVILEIILLLFSELSFGSILWIAIIVTVPAYLIGDILILPATNNTVATITDVILSLVTIYSFNFFWDTDDITFLSALIAAVVIGVCEGFFHYRFISLLHSSVK